MIGNIKRRLFGALAILLACSPVRTQNPGWVAPDAAAFSFNASLIATLTLDDTASNQMSDRIAVFNNNTLVGLSTPVQVGAQVIHFVSVYANQSSATLSIRAYHAGSDQVYDAQGGFPFAAQQVSGSIEMPVIIRCYRGGDAPIGLLPVPTLSTLQDRPFAPVALSAFLQQTDQDPVAWSFDGDDDVLIELRQDSLFLRPKPGFSGPSSLTLIATEQTPNAFEARTTAPLLVLAYDGPSWLPVPGEGIRAGEAFQHIDLGNYEDAYTGPCLSFDYLPDLEVAPTPTAKPSWTASSGFLNSMSITAELLFTPRYIFGHPDDLLAAFVQGDIRGVATPQQVNGHLLFFLTIGSNTPSASVMLKFYSGALKKVFELPMPVPYVAQSVWGTPDAPYPIDLSPLLPVVQNGTLSVEVRDTTWRGQATFQLIASDCQFPLFLSDTTSVSFCVTGADFTAGAISSTGETICYAGTPAQIGSTTPASGGDTNIAYSWRSSADQYAAPITGATEATYTPPHGLTATTSYRRYASDGTCINTPTASAGEWTVTIRETPVVTAQVDAYPTFGMRNGAASAAYTGGVEPVSLLWSNGSTTLDITDLPFGSYSVTATGANGCTTAATAAVQPVIRGNIYWHADTDQGVNNVDLLQTGDAAAVQTTDTDGYYAFPPIASGTHFLLRPEKTTDKLNGVSAADASRILRHVTRLDTLQGPYKLIAADVNGSNTISTLDAILLSQCILGNVAACNLWVSSWRFVDMEHAFNTPGTPWDFPETVTLTPSTVRNGPGIDFTGIKVADLVDPDANPQLRPLPLQLHAPKMLLPEGQVTDVPIWVQDYTDICAFQLALQWDPNRAVLEDIIFPVGGLLTWEHTGWWPSNPGVLRFVHAEASGITLEAGTPLCTLRMRALEDNTALSTLLHIDQSDIRAEAYTGDLAPQPIFLDFKMTTPTTLAFPEIQTLRALPNPSAGSTLVEFTLGDPSPVRLRVLDASGRLVYEHNAAYGTGVHTHQVDLPGSGVFAVELTSTSASSVIAVINRGK